MDQHPRRGTSMTQQVRKKGGLGRGWVARTPPGPADGSDGAGRLGARIGDAAADVLLGGPPTGTSAGSTDIGAVYREIDPAFIEPNPRQPRQVFDEEALAGIVPSIRDFGLMKPPVARAAAG